jgi:hypothetical protein
VSTKLQEKDPKFDLDKVNSHIEKSFQMPYDKEPQAPDLSPKHSDYFKLIREQLFLQENKFETLQNREPKFQ